MYMLYSKKHLLIKGIICSESLYRNNQQSQFDNNIAVGLFEGETLPIVHVCTTLWPEFLFVN